MPKELTPLERTQQVLDISATERAAFRQCRRKWELEVLENLTPRLAPTFDLEFGSGIHEALEAYYLQVSNLPVYPETEDKYERPLQHALTTWDRWYETTSDKVAQDKSLDTTTKDLALDSLVELADLGEQMLMGYDTYSSEEDDFTVHAVEGLITGAGKSWLAKHWEDQEFVSRVAANGVTYHAPSRRLLIPILDPKSQKPIKDNPVLSVRIDLIVHRIDPGMKGLWVYDHKTTGSVPSDRGLDFDDQITSYCYSTYRWLGIIPRGFCINNLVKKAPKAPRILSKGKLSTAKDQLTTATQYKEELIARGLIRNGRISTSRPTGNSPTYAECYESLLSHGWDRFFIRHYVGRNKHELTSFEERLYEEWQDMSDCYAGELIMYPNMSKMWCPNCGVAPICQAIEDGSDWEAIMDTRYEQKPDRKASI